MRQPLLLFGIGLGGLSLRAGLVVHGHGLDVEVGAVLGLVPEDVLGHQALGVELHPVQDDLLELLVPGAVNEVSAVEVLGL